MRPTLQEAISAAMFFGIDFLTDTDCASNMAADIASCNVGRIEIEPA